ncbi:histone deacetylase [Vibrio cholerae]
MIPLIYHPIYSDLPLPDGHRYPINKYRYLYEAIRKQTPWQHRIDWVTPSAITMDEAARTHCDQYLDLLCRGALPAAKMRRIGFPWSEQLITRTLTSAGGTCATVDAALERGVAIHLSGGYHHAHYDFGSGFCLINDLVIAAKRALTNEHVDTVLIVDSDVHHGDGTATLCRDEAEIITLSFHCDKNFPARKPDSNLDVALSKGTDDATFLSHFTSVVEMAVNLHQPDFILYDAGVDIHQEDELGYFNVSTQAIYQRDRAMFEVATRRGVPIACVVGGGYRTRHEDLVPIHMQLIQAAMDVYKD